MTEKKQNGKRKNKKDRCGKRRKGIEQRGRKRDYREAKRVATQLEIAAKEKGVPEEKVRTQFDRLFELIRKFDSLHKIAQAIHAIMKILDNFW